jgi:arylsulfatase A-like enzyme
MNVLFIMADQLRWDHLSCAGHPYLRTPHIDALAARGVRFTQAYVNSGVCGPSRMSYYTGRYPISHGATWNRVPLAVGERTLGEYLRDHAGPQGHDLWLAGKTHVIPDDEGLKRLAIEAGSELGHLLTRGGFREIDRYDGHHETRDSDGYSGWLRAQGYDSPTPWSDYVISALDERAASSAAGTCATCTCPRAWPRSTPRPPTPPTARSTSCAPAGDRPWVLHLSYVKPHWPYMAPAPYHAMYTATNACRPSGAATSCATPTRPGRLSPARGKPHLRARRGRAPCAAGLPGADRAARRPPRPPVRAWTGKGCHATRW